MFHPRGMGPRGMRPGMRPPFGPRGPPGPHFDPREKDPFFRPPFDDGHRPPGPPGPPGPMIRPPFGPMKGHDNPWRNQENGPWLEPGADLEEHNPRENHNLRDHPKSKYQDHKGGAPPLDRENRNRNRKSRWGNASPSNDDSVDMDKPEGEERPRRHSSEQFEPEATSNKFNESFDERPPGTENESFETTSESTFVQPTEPQECNLEGEGNQSLETNEAQENNCFVPPAEQSSEPPAEQSFEPTNDQCFEPFKDQNTEPLNDQNFQLQNNTNFEDYDNQSFNPPDDQKIELSNDQFFEPPSDEGFQPQEQQAEQQQLYESELQPNDEMKNAELPMEMSEEGEPVSECLSEQPCEIQGEGGESL